MWTVEDFYNWCKELGLDLGTMEEDKTDATGEYYFCRFPGRSQQQVIDAFRGHELKVHPAKQEVYGSGGLPLETLLIVGPDREITSLALMNLGRHITDLAEMEDALGYHLCRDPEKVRFFPAKFEGDEFKRDAFAFVKFHTKDDAEAFLLGFVLCLRFLVFAVVPTHFALC